MIYLDNNATTPVLPEVFAAMEPFLKGGFGNPSAAYGIGRESRRAVEQAREQVAALIDADPSEIIFTSGGTESITTAIQSAMHCFPERKQLLSTQVEHSATVETLNSLEESGSLIERIGVDAEGNLNLDLLHAALSPDVAIASMIWGNNETGVLSPMQKVAELCEESGVFLHADAVQTVGKIPVSVRTTPLHALSISGHKLHAPKGIGALYVSRRVRFRPLFFGGGQEQERRSGTENVASIVALGKAAELARLGLETGRQQRLANLRDRLEQGILQRIPEVEINGDPEQRLPNTSNLHFPGIDAEAILVLLDKEDIYCSPGSACSTGAKHPSPVLTAMGMDRSRARSSVRFSVSELNTEAEIDQAMDAVQRAVERIRMVMPGGGGPVVRRG